ncbi:MAG: adenylyltransferase/cytidyltransferase family protein [Candidatus Wildermuthbacteria bacterium]|nr:adenylyltransferase/cytidyltransferase family protein [Candidatus Wildermuthbacteria bacterium]
MKKVAVFGIFDGVHEGHRSLFSQAREYGDELVVIVGRDSASVRWKNKKPRYSEETRRGLVSVEQGVDKAVLGDEQQSSYKVLEDINPDVICLGYDQNALEEDIKRWLSKTGKNIPLIRLKPYQPERNHNSLKK